MSEEEFDIYNLLLKKKSDEELLKLFTDTAWAKNDAYKQEYAHHRLIRDEIKIRKLIAKAKEPEKTTRQTTREAVTLCYRKYKELKAKGTKNIAKREIAREATEKFFPHLTGNRRAKMINNIRNAYLKKVAVKRRK